MGSRRTEICACPQRHLPESTVIGDLSFLMCVFLCAD
jgi:hypothetical protein